MLNTFSSADTKPSALYIGFVKTILRILIFYLLIMPLSLSCGDTVEDQMAIKVDLYYAAKNRHDFSSPDYTQFKRDTSTTWHGERSGKGFQSIFNPNSGWNQWDIAWDGRYRYEIIDARSDSLLVRLRFTEFNEFLTAVGIPEGLSATVTFWFDEDLRVRETLYGWDDDNQSVHENLKTIVEWALSYDSAAIAEVYLNDGFEASAQKADMWKPLLAMYQSSLAAR